MILKMNRILTTLALVSIAATAVDASADYESKIQAALDNFAAHSEEVLQRAMKEGSAAIDTVGIDANGDIISSSSAELYADFGLKAVDTQLDKINELIEETVDAYEVDKEVFEELTAENGEDSTTITYEQLEGWDEMENILNVLKEGELLNLWRKATGSESDEGEMKLSQFVKFNNLLDKLLMAKASFMKLSGGHNKGTGISYDQLWNMDALSDDILQKDFFVLWKKALGQDVLKGDMSYEQFLVFWDLAEEWLVYDGDMGAEWSDEEEDFDEDEDYDYDEDEDYDYDEDEDYEEDYEEDDGVSAWYHGIGVGDTGFEIADEDLPDDIRADLESDDEDIRNEAMFRRRLDPERRNEFSYWELHAYFGCEKEFSSPRPLWTEQQWREVRDFYHEFIEEDKKDEDGPEGVHSYQLSEEVFDFSQNAIPFQSGEKGRGLQAVRDIKVGEMVFKATNNTIIFNYGHTWRKLLFAIDERFADSGMTCDMHVWSWVQDLYEGGPMKVVMDLDSGSLLNEGRDEPGWDPPNVQCGRPHETRCDMDYYAFRDIKKGDELLIDYNEFAWLESWPDTGL